MCTLSSYLVATSNWKLIDCLAGSVYLLQIYNANILCECFEAWTLKGLYWLKEEEADFFFFLFWFLILGDEWSSQFKILNVFFFLIVHSCLVFFLIFILCFLIYMCTHTHLFRCPLFPWESEEGNWQLFFFSFWYCNKIW